jgi:hypothetical protein
MRREGKPLQRQVWGKFIAPHMKPVILELQIKGHFECEKRGGKKTRVVLKALFLFFFSIFAFFSRNIHSEFHLSCIYLRAYG